MMLIKFYLGMLLRSVGASFFLGITAILFIFCAWLFTISIYRIYYHPLSKYPGPVMAKLTNAYSAYHAARQNTHVIILKLHKIHGDWPRKIWWPIVNMYKDQSFGTDQIDSCLTARRHLSVRLVDNMLGSSCPLTEVLEIYGQNRNFFKGRAYDAMRIQLVPSVFNVASDQIHSQRRKAISYGFSDHAMKACEPTILKHVNRYCRVLYGDDEAQEHGDWTSSREMTELSAFFAVDLIADLVTGRSPNMLRDSTARRYNTARKANFRRMGLAIQWPEVFLNSLFQKVNVGELLFPELATLGRQWHALLGSWISDRLQELRDSPHIVSQVDDLVSIITAYADPDTGKSLSDAELTAEMITLLIAGSGTITTGLTSAIWYLSRNPGAYSRVVEEIRTNFDSLDSIRAGPQLRECKYLRACFREAMRMSPAPTTPLYREAGTGGSTVCGVHVPESMEAAVSIYALHHNEAYHPSSFEFRPDRWLHGDVIRAQLAWAPFSYGPRNCIGMALATNEVLITISRLLWQGDFKVPNDSKLARVGGGAKDLGDGRSRESEFQMYDTFGASTEGPYLQFCKK